MPTQICTSGDKPIAQTIFLGASVSSFTNNLGWGTQPSQLTVNLIEDKHSKGCDPDPNTPVTEDYNQFPRSAFINTPNHYHTCSGIRCYIDRLTGAAATIRTPIENLSLPGKVYYELDNRLGLVSKYSIQPDPGFFGNQTRIDPNGNYDPSRIFKYDIIDTPVYFKMGNFQFGGFVQSWNKSLGSNGEQYTVTINSPQVLLNSSYIIIDKYAGSVFSFVNQGNATSRLAFYGVQSNYLRTFPGYTQANTDLYRGALPNVFNLYGFAESFGKDNFGTSLVNEQGMSVNMVLETLSILTSTLAPSRGENNYMALDTVLRPRDQYVTKQAFSTFGRLISKGMACDFPLKNPDNNNILAPDQRFNTVSTSFNKYGIVNTQPLTSMQIPDLVAAPRCQFVLDLSDIIYTNSARTIKRFPDAIRVPGPVLTITELLNFIGDKFGLDFFTEMIPVTYNNTIHNVIKVKCISRLKQPPTNVIENTIKKLECAGVGVSSSSIGKEKNDVASRCLLVGGQQQRLYQVKSYRLAYTQNNFIFNPRTRQFINYRNLPQSTSEQARQPFGYGKIRFPDFMSMRNPFVYDYYGFSSDVTDSEAAIIQSKGNNFGLPDTIWDSTTELGSSIPINYGNYEPALKVPTPNASTTASERWFPLFLDTICPFFGYVFDNKITSGTNSNTDLRTVRPVWYDTWTAQIGIICRIAELPQLNVSLNRASLESSSSAMDANGWIFNLPKVSNLHSPAGGYNDYGRITTYEPSEYFILTESEIRAALAGFDNFLVYSLAKTYKTDLIELVRRAYYIKVRNELEFNGVPPAEAEKTAYKETDWYWKLLGANIAGDDLYPTVVYPDKNDGSQYIQEKALQDLRIIHNFILSIAKYYGKTYMVAMPHLRAARQNAFSNPVAFKTNVGYGYIFSGPPGDLKYSYTPTNDGAWEEYGNVIDDSIVVGGMNWLSLVDDVGKIKPILGYNNNYNYDYVRQIKCIAGNSALVTQEFVREKANPYFSFSNWLTLYEHKTRTCTDSYIFPSIDLSSLGSTDYVLVNQKFVEDLDIETPVVAGDSITNIYENRTTVRSFDAWNEEIKVPSTNLGVVTSSTPLPKSKIYVPTSVNENLVFLDPTNLAYPKVIIDSPGLNVNVSSEENARDPNRTVISNVAAEDLMIYLKTNVVYDPYWVNYMLNYIAPMVLDDEENPYFLGAYTVSANHTANNVELAPKAAHPFFAAIPIKSNQFTYGPWTNYPLVNYSSIFTEGETVSQTSDIPRTCEITRINQVSQLQAISGINNLINGVEIEFNDDLVPWNYGGMIGLDKVAYNEIGTKISFQSVIETAQLDIVGLPIFNLGGNFLIENRDQFYVPSTFTFTWQDAKVAGSFSTGPSSYGVGNIVFTEPSQSIDLRVVNYRVIDLIDPPTFLVGPIISAISTSIGQQGITTTYTFRTYTRKLGLFNKEETDRIKKLANINITRGKQIAQINREISNIKRKERELLLQERLNNAQFGSSELSSKLFGWSPGTVLIGQAVPLINEPNRDPKYIEDFSYASDPRPVSTQQANPEWSLASTSDIGNTLPAQFQLEAQSSPTMLKALSRITSTVQLFERKEVTNQLYKDYGMQSAMSLDGLLSPISFYPTFKNSTFSYGLHNTANCPFCRGTKLRPITLVKYARNSKAYEVIQIVCDKCSDASNNLNIKLKSENDEDSEKPAINLITLNPIVVPYGEFKQYNGQDYSGAHPDGKHDDLTPLNPAYSNNNPRTFRDRLRHSIDIVARGSIPQDKIGYALETSRNFNASNPDGTENTNLDYAESDQALYAIRNRVRDPFNLLHANNQRFFGLRGPLTLHSWGYDDEGYPVPNAADEPQAYDIFGRPKRFKVKRTFGSPTKFKNLEVGKTFTLVNSPTAPVFGKTYNGENLPQLQSGEETTVYPVTVSDDMSDPGGFDPTTHKGSIIGKAQKFVGGKWTEKVRLKEFYLNWAERPDLWKVGPVDLIWDTGRMVWTGGGKGGCEEIMPPYIITNSNDVTTLTEFYNSKIEKKCPYKMIYATLEEDLIKQPDFDETFATRAFIDDVEFSKEPLLKGYRRLIYIKDKCAYTAPMGTKLLCRYNRDTGFYEPVTKPSVIAKGKISSSSLAIIDLNYIQGRRAGKMPTKTISFDNPLGFSTINNSIGIFTFIYGKWTLTSIKN